MRRLLAAVVMAACALGGCARASNADVPGSIDVGGVTRTYVAHVPAKFGASAPLVLSFHGHLGTGAGQSRLTGFDALSDEYGFIVVYPDGIRRGWDDGRPRNAGPDDVAFANALIADFSKRYPIDSKRIYATGFSNGATFSQYLGCALATKIAAIAPVSGYMPVEDAAGCHPARAISVLEIGGTADPIMPYSGGQINVANLQRGVVRSAQDTIATWASNARCAGKPRVSRLASTTPPDGTSVTRTSYERCAPGAAVVLYTVEGGGHAWPDGPQYLPRRLIGLASRQFEASRAIVNFFYSHPMH